MKTIITSTGNSLNSKFDQRFGRAGYFCVYDHDTETTNFVKNNFKDLNGGAGTKSSEMAAELGAELIVSGHFGPKAVTMLEKLSIKTTVIQEEGLSVEDVIKKLDNN